MTKKEKDVYQKFHETITTLARELYELLPEKVENKAIKILKNEMYDYSFATRKELAIKFNYKGTCYIIQGDGSTYTVFGKEKLKDGDYLIYWTWRGDKYPIKKGNLYKDNIEKKRYPKRIWWLERRKQKKV